MILFPFFENIEDKTFLVVGGGRVAREKIEKLQKFDANIVVVARETTLASGPNLEVRVKDFKPQDINGMDYVIAATDDATLNRCISGYCRTLNIPVNVVDSPNFCSFVFPGLVKKGDLTVGITTNGKSPAYTQYVRTLLEKELPDDTEEIIDELYALKERLKQDVPSQPERAKQLKAYLEKRLEEQ